MLNYLKELLGESLSEEDFGKIQGKFQEDYVPKTEVSKIQEDFESRLKKTKSEFAIEDALKNFGAKNGRAVKALLDEEQISFDEKGEVQGIVNQLEALKKSDPFLFEDREIKGLKVPEKAEKPAKNPQNMNYAELCKFFE